jgi:hypothetical protein
MTSDPLPAPTDDTRPDPLAALLHANAVGCIELYGHEPHGEGHRVHAARLRAAGVTLAAPAEDAPTPDALRKALGQASDTIDRMGWELDGGRQWTAGGLIEGPPPISEWLADAEGLASSLRGWLMFAAPDPACESAAPAEGLDVERLARAIHATRGHRDRHPEFRGCSTCSPDAAAFAREYAALEDKP